MKAKQISLIYFYLVSAASLALLVVGVVHLINFATNKIVYEQYPLEYQIVDCRGLYPVPAKTSIAPYPPGADFFPATPSAEEQDRARMECEENLSRQRKQKEVEDLRNGLAFSLIGSVLFYFHFTQARKHSKD